MVKNSFVLIGAGSTVFTRGLLHDLASNPVFNDFTVNLVDLNLDAAETMAALGRRIANYYGSSLRLEASDDRRKVLSGAKFVSTTVAVGGADAWLRDIRIPEKYGVHQTVGDTVGPGGVLRALRHVPVLTAIAEDIADLSPNAWMFNYSNPLTANVRGITKHASVKAIGLCHGTMHTKARLAADLGYHEDQISATFAGINHLCWLLDIRAGEVDLYPKLVKLVNERSAGIDSAPNDHEGVHSAVSGQLMKLFGRYPAPGDRHVSEFFEEYLRGAQKDNLPWGMQPGQDGTFKYIGNKNDMWDELRGQASGKAPIQERENQEAERLVSIAAAIMTGSEHIELAVNLPNQGLINNLPANAVVEVPALVNGSGILGIAIGDLPDGIAATLSSRVEQQELTVKAAIEGSRQLALQSLILDPLVPDFLTATRILDDSVAADPIYLSEFSECK